MATTAQLTLLMLGYYVMVGILVVCLSVGNMFGSSNMIQGSIDYGENLTQINGSSVPSSVWDTGSTMISLYQFGALGLDLGLGGFGNFLVTLIFAWFPGLIFLAMIYYSIRSGSS